MQYLITLAINSVRGVFGAVFTVIGILVFVLAAVALHSTTSLRERVESQARFGESAEQIARARDAANALSDRVAIASRSLTSVDVDLFQSQLADARDANAKLTSDPTTDTRLRDLAWKALDALEQLEDTTQQGLATHNRVVALAEAIRTRTDLGPAFLDASNAAKGAGDLNAGLSAAAAGAYFILASEEANRFLLAPTPSGAETTRRYLASARQGAIEADAYAPETQMLRSAVDAVEASFGGALILANRRASLLRNELEPGSQAFADAIAALEAGLDERRAAQAAEAETFAASSTRIVAICAILVLAAAAVGWMIMSERVAKPTSQITDALSKLVKDEALSAFPGEGRQDEFGRLAEAARRLLENRQELKRLREERIRARAQAAMRRREDLTGVLASFEDEFAAAVQRVVETADAMRRASSRTTEVTTTAFGESAEAVDAADVAGRRLQDASSAARALQETVNAARAEAADASAIATEAARNADSVRNAVAELGESVGQIGDVLAQINDIADQTNLLALNATIEAARAGAAGKGFAVVATEVKSLANQTSTATNNIAEQVSTLQQASVNAEKTLKDVAEVIDRLNQSGERIVDAISTQQDTMHTVSAATQEASQTVKLAKEAMTRLREGVATAGKAATDSNAAAEILSKESRALTEAMNRFSNSLRNALDREADQARLDEDKAA